MNLKDRILVLRIHKHGESDLIIHGLNPQGAKISFFARGAMRSKKRFAGGVLEPTHYIEVTYKARASDEGDPLHTLLEASLLREFPKLRTDYARIEAALYLLKLVSKLGQQGTIDSPDLFNLLGNALQMIETSSDIESLKLQFELKLLNGQGILPPDDILAPWLEPPLSQNSQIRATPEQRRLASARAHEYLRQYLGEI